MGKTFFFDLDGTLISDVYSVDVSVPIMFEKLKNKGHQSFVCTGRGNKFVPEQIMKYCDGMITLTGASATYYKREIFNHPFLNHFNNVIRDISVNGINVFLENTTSMILIGKEETFDEEERKMSGLCDSKYCDFNSFFLSEMSSRLNKINFRLKYLDAVTTIINGENGVEILDAGQGWCEMIRSDINKGTAVREIIELLQLNRQDTICFGDSSNDIAMFAECGLSVAVDNASNAVKRAADIVTDSCDNKGVEKFLLKNGFIDG